MLPRLLDKIPLHQAEALGPEAGIGGAFHNREVVRMTGISRAREPQLIMPAGLASRP